MFVMVYIPYSQTIEMGKILHSSDVIGTAFFFYVIHRVKVTVLPIEQQLVPTSINARDLIAIFFRPIHLCDLVVTSESIKAAKSDQSDLVCSWGGSVLIVCGICHFISAAIARKCERVVTKLEARGIAGQRIIARP